MLDHSTLDLGSVRLRAKDGLRFALRRRGEEVWYLVEDEINGNFYRIGIAEATLLSLLDGQRSVREALALAAQFSGASNLDEVAASGICNFLLQSGLVSTPESRSIERLDRHSESQSKAKRVRWLNPITISIPLINPDRFLGLLNRTIGFAIGWPLVLLGSLAILFGWMRLWMEWDQLTLHRLRAYAPTDWLWMMIGWLGVKLIHELGHGLVCKRLGGNVSQAGVSLFLFIPLPFINTSSAWSFARRSHRMAVVAAGVFFEMLAATVAILVWSKLSPGPWRFHLEDLILASMIHTLVFNLNPLMKFDGYFLLIDFLELSNLSQQGRRFVSSLAMKCFVDPQAEISRENRLQNFIRIYGVAAKIWMSIVMVGLLAAACNLLEGVGLLMAAMALACWAVPFASGLKRIFLIDGRWHRRRLKRATLSLGMLTLVMAMIGYFVPAPSGIHAPLVIAYREQATLRATAPGFIKAIHVSPDQRVRKGDLLIEIQNPELTLRRDSVSAQIESTAIQIRVAHEEQKIAEAMVLQDKKMSLEKQLAELESLIGGLKIHAPLDGEITTVDLPQRMGMYLNVGDEIVSLGDPTTMEAIALVKQADIKHLDLSSNIPSRVEMPGSATFDARVDSVAPRASATLPHFAFSASHGGTLSVVSKNEDQPLNGSLKSVSMELVSSDTNSIEGISLVDPRVSIFLELVDRQADEAVPFREGQTGYAYIDARRESLGGYLLGRLVRWTESQITRSHGL